MATHQAPLSMWFSQQEYWSGLPFPPPEDLPNQGRSNSRLLHWRQILYLLSHLGSLTSLRVSEEPGPEALLFLQSFCHLSLPSPSSKWGVEAGPLIRAVSLRFRGGKWCRGVARCEDAFTLFKGNISLASTMNTEVPHLLPHLKNGVFSPILGVGREVEKLWTSPCRTPHRWVH